MSLKPFSIQAPEEVAKAYGGNKQKIMQAAQLGVVDPTAAVLAGMFIDRMRNSAQAEMGAPPSIAQQVMAPPAAPPPGGPGGPPPGGPPPGGPPPGMGPGGPPPPPMGGPPPGMGAPPGMARGGGLDAIPVHEGMFTGDYTEGGLVAFAQGDAVSDGTTPDYGATADQMLPIIQQMETGSGGARPGPNTPYGNAQGFFQILPSTAKGLAREVGVNYDPQLASANTPAGHTYQAQLARQNLIDGLRKFGGDPVMAARYYQGGGNQAIWGKDNAAYGTNFAQRWQAGSPQSQPQQASGTQPTGTSAMSYSPTGYDTSFADNQAQAQQLLGGLPTDADQQAKQYFSQQLDPNAIKKQKTQDMWAALAQLGGTLASTPGPFLSALGASIAKTMPEVTADEKARKANQDMAINGLMNVEGIQRKDAMDVFNFGKDMWKENLTADQQAKLLQSKLFEIKQQGANVQAEIAGRQQNVETEVAGRHQDVAAEVGKPSDTMQEAYGYAYGPPPLRQAIGTILESKSGGGRGGVLAPGMYLKYALGQLPPNATPDQKQAVLQAAAVYENTHVDQLGILNSTGVQSPPVAGLVPPVAPRAPTALPQGWNITQRGG